MQGLEERRDQERLRRLASGDTAALAEIYDSHGERLFGHALWLLRRRDEAEDAVHEVFLKLWAMGADLLRIRRPATYLMRMVHHAALDAIASRSRRAELQTEPAYFEADGFDPERARLSAEAGRFLDRLPVDQREAVWLHLFEDLTFREVAKVTRVTTFTAASRYRLAIEKLRRLFEGT